MNTKVVAVAAEEVELLEETALQLHELARCCRVSTQWIEAHVAAGVLQPLHGHRRENWRFDRRARVRIRRIVQLEQTWDADPQLAALTADLMEEVVRLRRQLAQG